MEHRKDTARAGAADVATHVPLPVDRAFVVQIRADVDLASGDIRGRLEHVTSGSVTVFESVEQLVSSMRAAVAADAKAAHEKRSR